MMLSGSDGVGKSARLLYRLLCVTLTYFVVFSYADSADDGTCRLIGLGDIHGDVSAALRALASARIVDDHGRWIAGCSIVVQTGDVVDRGEGSVAALDYLYGLAIEARHHRGNVIMLLGNHEILNFQGVTTFVNRKELAQFGGEEKWKALFSSEKSGKYYMWLSRHKVVTLLNSTVFVHAGVLPRFAALGAPAMNRMASSQLMKKQLTDEIFGEDGPTWTRTLITAAQNGDCKLLDTSLALMGANRMVIGHTVQPDFKIGEYCSGRLIAIDVGMSRAVSGTSIGCVEIIDKNRIVTYYA